MPLSRCGCSASPTTVSPVHRSPSCAAVFARRRLRSSSSAHRHLEGNTMSDLKNSVSRRDVMQTAIVGAAASIAAPSLAHAAAATPQQEDMFYRDDWFGEPWRTPEAAVLIHGND